jgi:lysophospholipase L1-like esterase
MKKAGLVLSLIIMMAFTALEKKKITLWLIGDSTMSIKDPKTYPETGWGMPFVQFWDSTVKVDNRAKNGRSTKSFVAEGLWKPVIENMSEGDYVFIQFGHNDESKEKGERYSTPDEFKANLTNYITQSRNKKAIPILLTPVARRKFDESGKIKETHLGYSDLVKEVAKQQNVPLIDLDKKAQELYQQMGPENSKYLFNYLTPGEHPNYPKGVQDDTHFSELGARKVAEIVLAEIKLLKLELADRIVKK